MLKRYGTCAFEYSGLVTLTIPGTVEKIENQAFAHTSLKTVKILNGVSSIEYAAFWMCYDLQEIYLPDDLEEIPEAMCEFDQNLSFIKIGKNTKTIGKDAFKNIKATKTVIIDSETIASIYRHLWTSKIGGIDYETVYVNSEIPETSISSDLSTNYTKQEISDMDGYVKYVEN